MHVLVFGGSLGAKVLNETVPAALALFDAQVRPTVTHQCGKNAVESVKAEYEKLGIDAEVVSFIDDMAAAYDKADIVVCRAGATTVSELTAAGMPAVLVPFVVSTTAHQLGNARYMQENKAGILIEQKDLNAKRLHNELESLNREKLIEMGENARRLSRRAAAETVADAIEALVTK